MDEKREDLSVIKAVLDGIDDVIYVADPDTFELLHVNEAFQKFWGKDVLGKKCYRVLQNRDTPCPFCTNDKIFGEYAGRPYVWEF
ncbi:MAG: PAS domain-containing protein, partial [Desulfotignum sp.]|nr:PAS domain-containing protein [Desulfotignum sp.]